MASYSDAIRAVLGADVPPDSDARLLRAMAASYQSVIKVRKLSRFFEVGGWVAKPINYIPVVGNIASAVSDAKDVAQIGVQRSIKSREWFLFAPRALQVGIEDYLKRNHNRIG